MQGRLTWNDKSMNYYYYIELYAACFFFAFSSIWFNRREKCNPVWLTLQFSSTSTETTAIYGKLIHCYESRFHCILATPFETVLRRSPWGFATLSPIKTHVAWRKPLDNRHIYLVGSAVRGRHVLTLKLAPLELVGQTKMDNRLTEVKLTNAKIFTISLICQLVTLYSILEQLDSL